MPNLNCDHLHDYINLVLIVSLHLVCPCHIATTVIFWNINQVMLNSCLKPSDNISLLLEQNLNFLLQFLKHILNCDFISSSPTKSQPPAFYLLVLSFGLFALSQSILDALQPDLILNVTTPKKLYLTCQSKVTI